MSRNVSWARKSHEFLCEDKRLGKIAQAVGPPQIKLRGDPFQLLVQSVTGQQLSGRAAETIYRRTCELVGEIAPDRILNHSPDSLRTAGLSYAKAATLRAISEAALSGLDFDHLESMSDEEVSTRLTKIKGIGPWTAEMFMIFALGRPDVMSPGDLGLRKGLKLVYRKRELPGPKDCEKLYKPWRPYRSAASWYLWRAIEGENATW